MIKTPITSVIIVFALTLSANSQISPNTFTISGLKDAVTVRRDSRSIPYIEAKNDADLYFVQGYVVASDRLWQMDLLRRVARGETAEIFGKTTLEEDKRWRRYGFAGIVDESLKFYTPEMRAVLENYSRGVNAYIATLSDETLPVEFKILQYKPTPWTPADSMIVGKILAEALSSTYQRDLLRESLRGFDPQKLADLTNPVTPYDVVLFGKDVKALNAKTQRRKEENNCPQIDVDSRKSIASSITVDLCSSVAKYSSRDSAVEKDMALRESSLRRVGLYAEELAASNNWVISGKRTADGKAILANDPHLEATAPGIWYLAHLSTPTMRVSGVTFPGSPGVVLGHNEHIAWGATNVGPDVQDLYVETFEGKKYKTPTGLADAEVRTEKIAFRANPLSTALSYEEFAVTKTRNGPVIIERDGKKYSLKWTALDPKNNELEAFYFLNRAKDWNEFKGALKQYGGATQNFVYADTKGNIGWYAAGRIPIRKTGDGAFPYDGATNDGDWTGFIPFAELPNLYNPPEGFIVTANQRIAGTSYKYSQVSRDAAPPWRARRLYDLLKADTKATMDSVSAAQHDALNLPLSMFAKDIIALNAASEENLALMKAWDGKMTPDSKAALIVNDIRNCVSDKIVAENRPAPANVIRDRIMYWAIKEKVERWLPKGFADYGALIRTCDSELPARLTTRFGSDQSKWVWGSAFVSTFRHPLAVAPLIGGQFATPRIGIAGSGQTPNVGSSVSMRHIASPGNWDATRLVIPLGQSGDPKSPYFKDQFDLWRTGNKAVFPFSKEAVMSATEVSVTYSPK